MVFEKFSVSYILSLIIDESPSKLLQVYLGFDRICCLYFNIMQFKMLFMNHKGFSSRLSFSSTSLFQSLPFCFLLCLKKLYSRGDHKCVYVKMKAV